MTDREKLAEIHNLAGRIQQLAGEVAVVRVDLPTDGSDITDQLQTIFDAVPNGTPEFPTVIELGTGPYRMEGTVRLRNKRWVIVTGPPDGYATLRSIEYGPLDEGRSQRRHLAMSYSEFCTFRRIRMHGPHSERHTSNAAYAKYRSEYAFEHAFWVIRSHDCLIEDCQAYEIGGDGCYIQDSDRFTLRRLHVEANGRQGITGVSGDDLLIDDCTVVGTTRTALDLEPIGHRPDYVGVLRYFNRPIIQNSYLRAWRGIVFHRVSDPILRGCQIGGVVQLSDTGLELQTNRTNVRIENNEWVHEWKPGTGGAPPIRLSGFTNAHLIGNRVHRNTSDGRNRYTPAAYVYKYAQGIIEIRDNDFTGFIDSVKWKNTSLVTDEWMEAICWQIANNIVRDGEIQDEPDWLTNWTTDG